MRSTAAQEATAGTYRGRFAPSPSGWLHLGNARTALLAWVRARRAGGSFVMRVEDLDRERSRPEAVLGNLAELGWLGLDWDEGPDVGGPYSPYLQSQRESHYRAALDDLRTAGRLFESYLTRRELATEAVYGTAQRLADEALSRERRAAGRPGSLRFRVTPGTLEFSDRLAGPQRFETATEVGDFVVRRADGLVAYQLAVVVDDAAMAITEVVRGADLLSSTAAQLLLYRALELAPPGFAHVGLLLGPDGEKLSKRHGPTSLRELEAAGVRPQRVLGLLAATLGWLAAPRELDAAELLGLEPTSSDADQARDRRLTEADLRWLQG